MSTCSVSKHYPHTQCSWCNAAWRTNKWYFLEPAQDFLGTDKQFAMATFKLSRYERGGATRIQHGYRHDFLLANYSRNLLQLWAAMKLLGVKCGSKTRWTNRPRAGEILCRDSLSAVRCLVIRLISLGCGPDWSVCVPVHLGLGKHPRRSRACRTDLWLCFFVSPHTVSISGVGYRYPRGQEPH